MKIARPMSPRIQFASAVVLAVALAAYAASDLWRVPVTISIAAAALLIGGPALAVWVWSSRRPSRSTLARTTAMIADLPLADARIRALNALEDRGRFACVRGLGRAGLPAGLPLSVQELFSMYASIAVVAGEGRLSSDAVGPSTYRDGFVRIGTDLDAVELVVRAGEETVYELDGSETDVQEIEQGGIPSVYHWILIADEVFSGNAP